MVAKDARKSGGKERVTISLDPTLRAWLRGMVASREFGSVSHGVEKALDEYRTKRRL